MSKIYFKSKDDNVKLEIRGSQINQNTGDIDDSIVTFHGNNILEKNTSVYANMYTENDKYIVIGIHGYNPHCYPYLDRIIIIQKSTNTCKTIRLYTVIDKAQLQNILMTDGAPDSIFFTTTSAKGYLNCKEIFDDRKCIPHTKYNSSKVPDEEILSSLFTYEITDGYGILMKLKEDVDPNVLLRFDGFKNDYNAFKLWSSDKNTTEPNTLLFIDTNKYCTQAITWGRSTTIASDYVWQCRDKLLKCVKKVLPFHPMFQNDKYYIHLT